MLELTWSAAGPSRSRGCRGRPRPPQPIPGARRAWAAVEQHTIDREVGEAAGTFGADIRTLKPDAMIDMICFTVDSARQLVEGLRGTVQHFLHCGTLWMHGPSAIVPTTEVQRTPFGDYGIQKAAIERLF